MNSQVTKYGSVRKAHLYKYRRAAKQNSARKDFFHGREFQRLSVVRWLLLKFSHSLREETQVAVAEHVWIQGTNGGIIVVMFTHSAKVYTHRYRPQSWNLGPSNAQYQTASKAKWREPKAEPTTTKCWWKEHTQCSYIHAVQHFIYQRMDTLIHSI
jgi:hypothetical protein